MCLISVIWKQEAKDMILLLASERKKSIYEKDDVQTNLWLKVEKEGGIATSIQGIPTSQDNHIIYNLNGQRVKQTHKGIYVVNGKKIVVK